MTGSQVTVFAGFSLDVFLINIHIWNTLIEFISWPWEFISWPGVYLLAIFSSHNKLNTMDLFQEYTIYLLQLSGQFISFRTCGPSGNKLSRQLQQINLYIPSKIHGFVCVLKWTNYKICWIFNLFICSIPSIDLLHKPSAESMFFSRIVGDNLLLNNRKIKSTLICLQWKILWELWKKMKNRKDSNPSNITCDDNPWKENYDELRRKIIFRQFSTTPFCFPGGNRK